MGRLAVKVKAEPPHAFASRQPLVKRVATNGRGFPYPVGLVAAVRLFEIEGWTPKSKTAVGSR
jgi:hypothetical protein